MGIHIVLEDAGRRFNRDWIFRHIDFEIHSGDKLALLGNNGSGKSTLLQMLSGYLSPSEGEVSFFNNKEKLPIESVFKHLAMATPYTTVHEEMTLREAISFHFTFKQPAPGLSKEDFAAFLRLQTHLNKPIRFFSSGMKQRVKLGLAIGSASDLLLLDEPASNLDAENIQWYRQVLMEHASGRTVVICSNRFDPEYDFCNRQLVVDDFKKLRT